jgi:hypothetical protein
MKKILFSLTALWSMAIATSAQTVTATDVEAVPGETVTTTLSISDATTSYTGIQFALQFPATGFSVAADAASGWPGSIEIGKMTDGKVKFAAAASKTFGQAEVAISFAVADDVALGPQTVTVTDIKFENTDKVLPIDDVTFTVTVVNAHSVVLDENATEAPAAATGVNVRVKRTINAGEWSTICLPFAMTAEQCKAAFGNDVQLGDFAGVNSSLDDADNVVAITANFDNVTAIEANHPYIIKVSTSVSEFTVDGVDVVPNEEDAFIEFDNGKTGSRRVVYSGFYGTYHASTTLDEYTLFLNDGKFWYSKGNTKMKAFRAYFDFNDVLASVEKAEAPVLISFDGETTGIDGVKRESITDDRYYNLKGQRVENPTKGLYIKNGKKVVVK